MSRSKKKTPGVVAKGGKPLVKVTSGRRPKTCGELAALWPTLAKVPAEEAVRFERDLKAAKKLKMGYGKDDPCWKSRKPGARGSTPEFTVDTADSTRETYVCANVSPDQLRWFRAFMRRHKFSVRQSCRHRSGKYTYAFIVPLPRLDRRWHEVYRELYDAKIDMIGDLD